MRVLAIDTTLQACAAALLDTARGEFLALESQSMSQGHAEALMPLLARVMDGARCEFADLDRIAVTVGPGSFTGLRVGLSAARGLALAAARPAVGLSTLAAFAAPHISVRKAAIIVSSVDARHGHVYLQVFTGDGRTLRAPALVTIEDAVQASLGDSALIVGSGAALIAENWPGDAPPPAVEASAAPDIGWVARLGAVAEERNAPPNPVYLRKPDARPQDAARLPRR